MIRSCLATLIKMVVALLTVSLLPACGMMLHGTWQNILCTTTPSGAKITSADGSTCTTPCSVNLKRKKNDTIVIEREGYEQVTLSIRSGVSKSFTAQILLPGGLAYWGIDLAFGGGYELRPGSINIQLKPLNAQERRSTGSGEVVTRNEESRESGLSVLSSYPP